MSTINKLSIRGIRSFGTENEDKQDLEFLSPLTLILGDNGCGKTTIIECIKYALTGEIPPGCSKGQSFVHDPNIFHAYECLGQVKLQVRTFKGDLITICRSMKTIVKNKQLRFETLDSTITAERNGKKESISKRCNDANSEMAYEIGASKAIINNVLFCHQEESNWPLDEGKKLKEKFDAIFGTTGYNKSIEKFIKLRKTYEIELKTKESDLKYLRHIKKENETKKLEMENAETKLKKIQDEIEKCDELMKPNKERLMKIQSIEREVSTLLSKKIELTTKLQSCKDQQTQLLKNIKEKFNGTEIQLDREIRTFKERMSSKNQNLIDNTETLKLVQREVDRIQNQLNDIERNRGTLLYKRQQEQEQSDNYIENIKRINNELKLNLNVQEFDKIDPSTADNLKLINVNYCKPIKIGIDNEEKKLNEISKEHEKIDNNLQILIDKLREEKVTAESNIKTKNQQIHQLKQEQTKLNQEILTVEQSAATLKKLNIDLDKVNKVYDEYCKAINPIETKQKIVEKRVQRDELQKQFDTIDEQVTFLTSISQITADISSKEKDLENRENEIKKVKNKHSDNLKNLLNNSASSSVTGSAASSAAAASPTIESNYKQKIQLIYQNMQKEIKCLQLKQTKNQQLITELQFRRKQKREDLRKCEKELQEYEDKIFEHCQSVPYEEVVQRLKENIAKIQLDYGAFKSSEALYKRYIKKMEENPCCPLCHKDMVVNEIEDLTTELTDEIQRLPQNIERTEKSLKIEQRKYDQLLALQTIMEKIEKFKNDIPILSKELKDIEEKLTNANNENETFDMLMAEPTSTMELANSMLGDMTLLDEGIKDSNRITKEIQILKSKLPERTVQWPLEDLQIERSTVMSELKFENSDIEKLQSKYDNENDMMNQLREKRTTLKDKQINLQEGVQALSQIRERHRELTQQIDASQLDLTMLQSKVEPLNSKLQEAVSDKQKQKDENRKKLNTIQLKFNEFKKSYQEIIRFRDELQKMCELNLQDQIERMKILFQKQTDEQQKKEIERKNVSKIIEEIKEEISNQELLERNLMDNLELKKSESNEKELQKQYEDLIKDMSDYDFGSVSREKDTIIKKQDNLIEKRSEYIGQIGELKHTMKTIKNELDKSENQNALKNYRSAFYEVEILKKIITDMGQYRIALEWALMKYHSEKMDLINRTIRELWREIYRGNDIDYIQIKTDEMKSSDANRRRVFDYRVVQSKNNVEIDMRGRCSAGQRVLACLIIRMALAETFCNNCGVLALDEPTTNLDRENIDSLCAALNKMLNERRLQSNYMMIIITHDKEFLNTLSKVDDHYTVFRNKNGKSVIQKTKKDA